MSIFISTLLCTYYIYLFRNPVFFKCIIYIDILDICIYPSCSQFSQATRVEPCNMPKALNPKSLTPTHSMTL